MCDALVVGGGVIGLSVAFELAEQGLSVRLLEQGQLGREASWAGAGMLPPGNLEAAKTREARLRGASHALWPKWTERLQRISGIDPGYLVSGGLEVRLNGSHESLANEVQRWRDEHVDVEPLDSTALRDRFPALSPHIASAYFLPKQAQVRNPWLLKALQAACVAKGVELLPGHPVVGLERNGRRLHTVRTPSGSFSAGQFVFASGAWSRELLLQAGFDLEIEPIRGQIVLLTMPRAPLSCIVQVGHRYLVPRSDGRILIGSTEERAGFDKRTTAGAMADLLNFARELVPSLEQARFEQSWSGLRPYLPGGLPFLGRVPTLDNVCAATGHYRAGLQLSPITAVLIRQLILGQSVDLPLDVESTR